LDLLIGIDEKDFISINIVLIVEEFSLALENDTRADNKSAEKAPNINRNKYIYEGLRNYLAAWAQVRMHA